MQNTYIFAFQVKVNYRELTFNFKEHDIRF